MMQQQHGAPSTDEQPIRILLADDHALVRKGIRLLLESDPGLRVIGEAQDGVEAVALALRLTPDVVLMDISMPKLNGIAATRRIHNTCPEISVIVLTMHDSEAYFYEMLKAGGNGYVLKDAAPDELVSAVRSVAHGEAYLAPAVVSQLIHDYAERAARMGGGGTGDLTPREREILTLVAEGLTNRKIAERLVVSVKTVETHRTNLMQKLDLHDRTELVKYAIRKGLITLDLEVEPLQFT